MTDRDDAAPERADGPAGGAAGDELVPVDTASIPAGGVRQAARERAEELRRLQRRRDRSRRWILRGSLLAGIVAVLAIVSVVLLTMVQPEGRGPRNMASDGIRIGAGLVPEETAGLRPGQRPDATEPVEGASDIRIYVDYLSPNAGEFERINGEQIRTWVEQGIATVEIHPIAMLTSRSAGTQYSLRAANAAACVAQFAPEGFLDFHRAMLLDQPAEGQAGFDDEELVARASAAGASSDRVRTCITSDRFRPWVQAATTRALNGPLPDADVDAVAETPTVIVRGSSYPYVTEPDPDEFARFMLQVGGSVSNEEPTPTPTPEPDGEQSEG